MPKALEPLKVAKSVDDGPFAVKTILGWTVHGPLGGDDNCETKDLAMEEVVEPTTEAKTLKLNTKRGKKLKKRQQLKDQEEQEDPDCYSPAPKKKKKKTIWQRTK